MTREELKYFKQFTDPIECKNRVHKEALMRHIQAGQRSSLFMSPGSGKTRVGIIAAGENIRKYGGKWLLSLPKENLIAQWEKEFIKWKYNKELKNVTIICHASNSKYSVDDYDGVIIDEVHLAINGEVHGALLNYDYKSNNKKLLCLTGTKPEKELLEKLTSVAPCAFELTLDEAVQLGMVAPYLTNVIYVPFTDKEAADYKKTQQAFVYYKMLLGNFEAFETATAILKDPLAKPADKQSARMFYNAIRKRKDTAQKAINKFTIAKEIIDLYPDDYIITFSEANAFSNELSKKVGERALVYHSDITVKERAKVLARFKDRRNNQNVLCSTKALSEGLNIENINNVVITAFTSKSHTLIQRLARSIRVQEGKQAKVFILCVPGTQEETWLQNALKNVSSVRYFESIEAYKNLL